MVDELKNQESREADIDAAIGTDRFIVNVASGWGAHVIVLIVGLIVPRLISDSLGKVSLGVWDFGWSTVKYLSLSNFGIASALGRYTAMYRASKNDRALAESVASVFVLQGFLTSCVLAIIVGLYFTLPHMLPDVLAGEVREIQLVVTTLGLAFVVQLLVGPARGILSGHHRWKTNNVINAACDLGGAAGMIGVLLAGGELHHVALAFLLATVIAEMFRFAFAAKQINDIRVRLADFQWNRSKELVRFGIKTSVMVLPMLFALQTTNIILAGAAGAAALAIFARPLALVSQVNALVNKFSLVLTPMASSLVGLGDSHRIQKIFIHSLRISCILSGFMLSVLFVFGDWIIGLWMGQDFVNKEVISILALGMYLPVAMSAALQILAGLNAHGRASLLALGVTVIVYGSMYSFAVMGSGFDQTTAALTLSAALTAGLGMAVPIYASRKIGISFPDLILKSVLAPTVPIIVACMMMQLIRYSLPLSEVMAFGSGVIVGASIVGLSWWYFLSSKALRQRLAGFLRPNAGKLEV